VVITYRTGKEPLVRSDCVVITYRTGKEPLNYLAASFDGNLL